MTELEFKSRLKLIEVFAVGSKEPERTHSTVLICELLFEIANEIALLREAMYPSDQEEDVDDSEVDPRDLVQPDRMEDE